MMPACDHTGTPRHFHSSTTSGSASLMSARTRASIAPRQSPSSLMRASIRREGESSPFPAFKPLLLFGLVVVTIASTPTDKLMNEATRREQTNPASSDRLVGANAAPIGPVLHFRNASQPQLEPQSRAIARHSRECASAGSALVHFNRPMARLAIRNHNKRPVLQGGSVLQ